MKIFDWAYREGDPMASQLDYIPMPEPVVKKAQAAWKAQVKDVNGAPVRR